MHIFGKLSEPVSLRFKRGKQTKLNLIYFWKGPVFVVGNANAVKSFNAFERALKPLISLSSRLYVFENRKPSSGKLSEPVGHV